MRLAPPNLSAGAEPIRSPRIITNVHYVRTELRGLIVCDQLLRPNLRPDVKTNAGRWLNCNTTTGTVALETGPAPSLIYLRKLCTCFELLICTLCGSTRFWASIAEDAPCPAKPRSAQGPPLSSHKRFTALRWNTHILERAKMHSCVTLSGQSSSCA